MTSRSRAPTRAGESKSKSGSFTIVRSSSRCGSRQRSAAASLSRTAFLNRSISGSCSMTTDSMCCLRSRQLAKPVFSGENELGVRESDLLLVRKLGADSRGGFAVISAKRVEELFCEFSLLLETRARRERAAEGRQGTPPSLRPASAHRPERGRVHRAVLIQVGAALSADRWRPFAVRCKVERSTVGASGAHS